jgi:isopenicillin N synthase-like dioxygenase
MSLAIETEFGRQSRDLPRKSLRILDVGPALTGDRDAIEALAMEWREVWEGVGFMSIINHGVSLDVTRRMTEAAKAFHDLPRDVKNSIPVTRDQKGYIPTPFRNHDPFRVSSKQQTRHRGVPGPCHRLPQRPS